MRKVDENRCPFCGSRETNIMVPTYASCHTENGRLVAELYEAPKDVPYTEMFGYCNNCGARFSVKEINKKGAIFEEILSRAGSATTATFPQATISGRGTSSASSSSPCR